MTIICPNLSEFIIYTGGSTKTFKWEEIMEAPVGVLNLILHLNLCRKGNQIRENESPKSFT